MLEFVEKEKGKKLHNKFNLRADEQVVYPSTCLLFVNSTLPYSVGEWRKDLSISARMLNQIGLPLRHCKALTDCRSYDELAASSLAEGDLSV
jgi:hypothetical protein